MTKQPRQPDRESDVYGPIFGKMSGASSSSRLTGPCGNVIEIYLRIENDYVVEANFQADGCGANVLCGFAAAKLAVGRSIDELPLIDEDAVAAAVGALPEADRHCAGLAAEALLTALHNYLAPPDRRENCAPEGADS